MTDCHRRRWLHTIAVSLLFAILVATTGCGPLAGRFSRRSPSVPPAPIPTAPAPPSIPYEGDAAAVEPMTQVEVETAAHSAETDAVIEDAEGRFEAGEAFYAEGDVEIARRLFDESIEVLLNAPQDVYDRDRVKVKCDELVEAIYSYDVQGLGASGAESGYEASPLDELLAVTFPVDPNVDVTGAGEWQLPASAFPLEVNGQVLQYVRYFSAPRGRRTLVAGLERLGRYRPMIQRILDEEGLPQELMYLPLAESGYNARALSRKRATGMWQFMTPKAREYGLVRTSYYDDRLDPEKATRAAARHLRDLYNDLGDWYLALAAFNAGTGRITRAVRRTGHVDFWELGQRRALPRETRNYVAIILATILMAKNPAEYGLEDLVADPPFEYNTVELSADTHLGLLADILREPIEVVQELNPALLTDVAPAGYPVHLPKGAASFVIAALETVPPGRRAYWRLHHVTDGETLQEIAQRYRTTTEQLHVANGGALTAPEVGDLVVIPISSGEAGGDSTASGSRKRPRAGS